nr:DUF6387 family protein [uncultured Methylophaga sp.]
MNHAELKEFIPPDFELSKYVSTAELSLSGWLENLTARLLAFQACQQSSDTLGEPQKSLIESQVTLNLQHGVVTTSQYSQIINALLEKDTASYSAIVRELTHYDLFSMAKSIELDEMRDLYDEIDTTVYHFLNQSDLGELNTPLSIFSMDDKESSWLEIDLNSSDKEIKTAFNQWLEGKRRTEHAHSETPKNRRNRKFKAFNAVTLRKWHDARVLQYIDVMTWNVINGKSPSYNILGNILFPEAYDLSNKAERVEEVVVPYVHKLMNVSTLRRMVKTSVSQ